MIFEGGGGEIFEIQRWVFISESFVRSLELLWIVLVFFYFFFYELITLKTTQYDFELLKKNIIEVRVKNNENVQQCSILQIKQGRGNLSHLLLSSASLFLVVSFCQAHILEIRWLFLD